MNKYRFKAFYYDLRGDLIGTDIINQVGGYPNYKAAYTLACEVSDAELPQCASVEVCLLAEKNPVLAGTGRCN